jgi:DNA-binding NtrC family response regulator
VRHLPPFLKDDSLLNFRQPTKAQVHAAAPPAAAANIFAEGDLNLGKMEEKMIRLALDRTADNRTEAARLLGISRRTMQRKLKEMGLIDE